MKIEFYKYQGTGNDFILLDNRTDQYNNLTQDQIAFMCNRRFGIGADGLMLLNKKEGFDFEMKYYNSDGAEGSMCGNGGRCIVKFAASLGIRKNNYHFIAFDGEHEAEIDIEGFVRLKMKDVKGVEVHSNHFVLNTGSPHYVKYIRDIMDEDIKNSGKMIRYGKRYEKEGINVDFVEQLQDDKIFVRTYERGVEDETMSCGTGVTASALIAAHNDNGFNRVDVKTPGGSLSVEFEKRDEDTFENIWLIGPAIFVFKGEIELRQ